jgi:YHS domain-containing protein
MRKLLNKKINSTIFSLFLLCIVISSPLVLADSERFIEITERNKVCMVNNFYNPMADFTQFKVSIENKNYYGCCAECKANLRENPAIRTAVDPLTNESVDKGLAYMVADKLEKGAVLYFKNKNNYLKYAEKK